MVSQPIMAPAKAGKAAAKRGSDTSDAPDPQVREAATRRLPVQALARMRWSLIAAEIAVVLVTWRLVGWSIPLAPCALIVAALSAMNLAISLSPAYRGYLRPWSGTVQIAVDIVGLIALLWFSGGMLNPFAMLIIAPVATAGGALSARRTTILFGLASLGVALLTVRAPPPLGPGWSLGMAQDSYRLGRGAAMIVAMGMAAGYASWSSAQTARRALALRMTETVLAREQRMSALGALSAAVAHELGTPLATISVIATELSRDAPAGPLRDDAELLVQQARRCRDILRRLAEMPEQRDRVHERMSLLQLVREIVEPFSARTDVRVEGLVSGPPDVLAPDVWRRAEIQHAITAFVENAVDFARREILLTARFDRNSVSLEVLDDGPGFSASVLRRLGQPYVTSRPSTLQTRTGHGGMGLGIFIATTLLERSGAAVTFTNAPSGGARASAKWPRSRIDADADAASR